MKTYVLTVSKTFPSTHPKAGKLTEFRYKIATRGKIHTIRMNYELWKKRIDNIKEGKAVLSVRTWSGKPYRSEQVEEFRFTDVGIQKLQMTALGWFIDDADSDITTKEIAVNDGLSIEDFAAWFKGVLKEHDKEMAIIHFTDFRYK